MSDEPNFSPSFQKKTAAVEVVEALVADPNSDNSDEKNARAIAVKSLPDNEKTAVLKLAADYHVAKDDPVWLLIRTISAAAELPAKVSKEAEDAATKVAAESIMKANQELMKIRKQTDTVAAESIMTTHRLIEEKIGKEIRDGASELAGLKRSIVDDKNESVAKRFAIPAVIVLLAIGAGWLGGGGMFDRYLHANEYATAIDDQAQWTNFARHWQHATSEEQATIRKMMDRKL